MTSLFLFVKRFYCSKFSTHWRNIMTFNQDAIDRAIENAKKAFEGLFNK